MDGFERIDRELVRKGSIVNIYEDTMKFPDGRTSKWDFIAHKGAAAIVPVTEDGKILLVRQYRNSIDRLTLEIPAGGLDSTSESTYECAKRELEEETGYKSDNLEFMFSIKTAIAFTNENIDIYLATNLKKGVQHLDPDEFINVEAYDVEELMQKIYANEIQDSKTMVGIMAYYLRKNEK